MRCRKAERLISRSLDSRLPGRAAKGLELHLAGCPPCRSYRVRLDTIQNGAAVRGETTVPPGYWDDLSARVRARIEREAAPCRRRRLPLRGWRWAWVAVPAAAIMMVSLHLFRPAPQDVAHLFSPQTRLESEGLATLDDPELAGELEGIVSAAIREETGGLSLHELPDFADDPGFWEGLTDEEVSLLDREIAEELKS